MTAEVQIVSDGFNGMVTFDGEPVPCYSVQINLGNDQLATARVTLAVDKVFVSADRQEVEWAGLETIPTQILEDEVNKRKGVVPF